MSLQPQPNSYLKSLADELLSQADRVRQLIGDKHWLSDGSHKESLLRDVIARHMPHGVLVARGFVLSPDHSTEVSKEIDILILDTRSEAPILHAGDLAMAFPQQVLAAVSVKTILGATEIADTWANLQSVRRLCLTTQALHTPWCGGFFFQMHDSLINTPAKLYDIISRSIGGETLPAPPIKPSHGYLRGPNMLAAARGLACLFDYSTASQVELRVYECDGLAASVFLANLVDHVSHQRTGSDCSMGRLLDGAAITPLQPFHIEQLSSAPSRRHSPGQGPMSGTAKGPLKQKKTKA